MADCIPPISLVLAAQVEAQQGEWLERLGRPRRDAAVRRLNERKWGRVWECDELLDLVERFEESVATPKGG